MCLSTWEHRLTVPEFDEPGNILIGMTTMRMGKMGAMIGLAFLTGLIFVFPQIGKFVSGPPVAGGNASIHVRKDRAESGPMSKQARGNASKSGLVPGSFTSDELVAIYESKGAAAAIAVAKGMTGPERETQVTFILTYLARTDPELAAGELKGAGLDLIHQKFVVDDVMSNWTDGKKALEWATSSLAGEHLKSAVGKALRTLVETDPDAALAYLDTLPACGSRDQAILDIFVAWGQCDPKAALKILAENFPVDERPSAIRSVILGWSRTESAKAAAWVAAIQDETERVELMGTVVRSWKSKSPAEASAWVKSLPEGRAKEAGKLIIHSTIAGMTGTPASVDGWKTKMVASMNDFDFRNWAWQDPDGARKFLETDPKGKDLAELASTVALGMSRKDGPAATFDWAQTLQGQAAEKAMRAVVIRWSGSDPAAAAEKINAIAPEQRPPLATALVENWTQSDPASAAAWVKACQGPEQTPLVREILQRWTDSQPREAYAWLGTLPMGPSRDEGINYLMRREAPSDPESVLPWIGLLSEPKLREEMRRTLDAYFKTDREGK